MLNLCKNYKRSTNSLEIDLRKRDSVENFLFSLLILNLKLQEIKPNGVF
jgi:hypothetical protein